MRRSLVLVYGLVLACSEEGGRTRDEGVGGGPVAQAGSAGAPGSGGSSGSSAATAGSGGGPDLGGFALGDALEFVAGTGMIPYAIGDNPYGIRGGGFLARAAQGNTISVGNEPGKICISGSLEEVPVNANGGGNYSQYWGVEFGFNLNQGVPEGGGAPAPGPAPSDAGADAGDAAAPTAPPPMEVAQPWQLGSVVGFSFVIEGPTINLIRFKTLPAGFPRELESSVYCKEISAVSGQVQTALFTEIDQYCWGTNLNLLVPTSGGLDNIAWQLPADVATGPRPFDWCLSDLRPIVRP